MEEEKQITSNTKSCMNCIWCSCKNYGHDRGICNKYISEKFTGDNKQTV